MRYSRPKKKKRRSGAGVNGDVGNAIQSEAGRQELLKKLRRKGLKEGFDRPYTRA